MILPILLLVPLGLAISMPLTAWLIHLGHRWGAMDSPGTDGHEKEGLRGIPNIGGVAIFAGIFIPLSWGLALLHLISAEQWSEWLPALAEHLPRIQESTPTALALLGCLAALHGMGLVDDRKGLSPGPKLVVQIAAAAVMTLWFDVRLLTFLGPVPSVIITILWIVVITNAINFLDNMDGLAGGVSAIATGLFMTATILNHQWFIAGTLALLLGALMGFLHYNRPPARIFMGDGGSLIVGFLLAVLTARTTWFDPEAIGYALGTKWYGVFMPVIVLAIPLYDFFSVTFVRLKQGRSPFVGDQQHFSHRLVQRGMSKRGAVLMICGLTLITGIGGISLGSLQPWQAILVGVQTIVVLGLLAGFEHASRHAVNGDSSEI